MPYVPVPKDLTKVKTKLAFNLTKRQLICFSLAGLVGLPVYFFTRGAIGNSAAVLLMIGLMMPFFFFAMYERDGQPAEKILKNRLRYKLWPKDRPYTHAANSIALFSHGCVASGLSNISRGIGGWRSA